jgi:hypothetical protein
MSKQRRTADDFVRDMKAKQQHSASGDIERKTSEGGQSSNKTPARPQRPATRLHLFRK